MIEFGLIACLLVVPYAVIMGGFRGIPPFWRYIDTLFGLIGIVPLWVARRMILGLEQAGRTSMQDSPGGRALGLREENRVQPAPK